MKYCKCGNPDWRIDTGAETLPCRKCYLIANGHENWLEYENCDMILSDGNKTITRKAKNEIHNEAT